MILRLTIVEIDIIYFLYSNGWKTEEEISMEQKCENNTECKTIKYNERYVTEVIRGRLTRFCSLDKETNDPS